MSKTSKMHMHVENLEVAKYKMGKVDGDENKLINGRHQTNKRPAWNIGQKINKRAAPNNSVRPGIFPNYK